MEVDEAAECKESSVFEHHLDQSQRLVLLENFYLLPSFSLKTAWIDAPKSKQGGQQASADGEEDDSLCSHVVDQVSRPESDASVLDFVWFFRLDSQDLVGERVSVDEVKLDDLCH